MTTEQQAPKKSIWKSKWLWITIGVIVAISVIGNIINPPDDTADTETETEAAPAIATVAVPDVAGLPADEARAALADAGFAVTFDAGDEAVFDATNWAAVSTTPQSGTDAEEASEVTVTVERSEEWLAEEAAKQKEAEEHAAVRAPDAPIHSSSAHAFCEEYAIAQFPYGIKFHRLAQVFADEKTDTGWYYKLGADITNEFGAKAKDRNIECHMSGTNEAPVMDNFLAY